MNVSLHDVHQALVQLGRLRFGEMNIEEAVREIVHTTHAMFSVDGAGLMLVDADQHLRNVAASDERFAHLEELQIRHQEGPCIDAFDAKELVGVEDLESEARWPAFREAAVARRVRAVLASPLPYNQDAVGVVAVVSEQRRPWTPEAELALLAFTDLAALLIASMMQGQQQSEVAVQLQAALKSRQVIEQAKGVLVGRDGIAPREAYVQLRARARNERRKLVTVCGEVVKDAASGPAGRLRQVRAGSAFHVVSTPPQIMRLVVMSVLVAAASPGSPGGLPPVSSRPCVPVTAQGGRHDHPRYHPADRRLSAQDRDRLDHRHRRTGHRPDPGSSRRYRPGSRGPPALLVRRTGRAGARLPARPGPSQRPKSHPDCLGGSGRCGLAQARALRLSLAAG
jgi:hypothetical protein